MRVKKLSKNKKGILVSLLVFALAFSSAMYSMTIDVNATSTRIGHATNDERGGLRGGKAGDQTGGEVGEWGWRYGGGAFHWTFVARAKDVRVSAKMAQLMKEACANSHIGYDQSNRLSLYKAAKAAGWDISAITTNVECDCISLVATVATAAGAPVSPYAGSSSLKSYLLKSGDFEIFTSSSYTASTENLQPGDILCAEGKHACMVIESPNPLCFDVTYNSSKTGKETVAKVPMGDEITLNYNNGNETSSVVVDDHKQLKDYEESRSGYSVKGWQKIGDKSFSAVYTGSTAAIRTGNTSKKVEKK